MEAVGGADHTALSDDRTPVDVGMHLTEGVLAREMSFGARRRLSTAWRVVGLTSLMAEGELTALILLLPPKEPVQAPRLHDTLHACDAAVSSLRSQT